MSNRSNLPSLDELSEHIAEYLYLHIDHISNNCPRNCCTEAVDISDLKKLVSEAIIEISTQERE